MTRQERAREKAAEAAADRTIADATRYRTWGNAMDATKDALDVRTTDIARPATDHAVRACVRGVCERAAYTAVIDALEDP